MGGGGSLMAAMAAMPAGDDSGAALLADAGAAGAAGGAGDGPGAGGASADGMLGDLRLPPLLVLDLWQKMQTYSPEGLPSLRAMIDRWGLRQGPGEVEALALVGGKSALTAVAVPEPSAAALFAAAGISVLARRRRRHQGGGR